MTGLGYTVVGAFLTGLGLWGVVALAHPLRKLLALNIMGSGVFLILVATTERAAGGVLDPVPHALVLTGLVVAVSATSLGLVLMLRYRAIRGTPAESSPESNAEASEASSGPEDAEVLGNAPRS